jgi:hypothetical protein
MTSGLIFSGPRPVSPRALVLLAIAGLALCFALRDLRIGLVDGFAQRLPQISMFPWLVFAVALWRAARSRVAVACQRADLIAVLGIALATIPLAAERSLAGIGLCVGAMGLLILWRWRGDADMRAAAVCMLALCANLSIAPLVFRLGYHAIIGVDMALLQAAITASGAPVTATPAGLVAADGMRVTLVGACSSFAGISAAILVHMGWAMVVRSDVSWRDGVAVAATVCLATAINIVRLTLTASGQAEYAFWHGYAGENPLGSQFFWFAQHAVLLTGGYLSAYWAGRTDPVQQGRA